MKQFKYTINGNVYKVTVNKVEDTLAEVEVNGIPYKVQMDKPAKKQVITVKRPVQTHTAASAPQTTVSRPANTGGVGGAVKSPLPGVILDIECKVGDTVKKGQKLFILEAMKMENTIPADRDGVIAEIKVSKGDSVLEGTELVTFK
jgi:Acetyl/propionyl-CoA carboxylase, alpha subunit